MSQENVQIARQAFEAWESGDLTTFLALLSDDFVARRHAPMPDPGEWHGREGLLHLAMEWGASFGDWEMKAKDVIDVGDAVVVHVAHKATGTESGAGVTGEYWYLARFRDGKATAMEIFATRTGAVEAAGLSE